MLSLDKKSSLYKNLNKEFINKFYKAVRNTYVMYKIKSKIIEANDKRKKILLIEGVQLEEYQILGLLDYSIFVSCSDKVRYERLNVREQTVMKKERIKTPDYCDYILNNDFPLEELKNNVKVIAKSINDKTFQKQKKNNN